VSGVRGRLSGMRAASSGLPSPAGGPEMVVQKNYRDSSSADKNGGLRMTWNRRAKLNGVVRMRRDVRGEIERGRQNEAGSAGEIEEGLTRNSMNYSFQLGCLGRAHCKALYLLLAPPEPPRHCPALIPGGDQDSSRGQRPRKTRPPQGSTLKGSNPGGVTPVLRPWAEGNTTPSGSGNEHRAFRGRCPRLLSCALAGRERPTVRCYPAAPVSDTTDSVLRLSSLRMTRGRRAKLNRGLGMTRGWRAPDTRHLTPGSRNCEATWKKKPKHWQT
jgi:hypothetical protein